MCHRVDGHSVLTWANDVISSTTAFQEDVREATLRKDRSNEHSQPTQLTLIFPEANMAAERINLFTGSLSCGDCGNTELA